jgi:hypothetical protein
MNRKIVFYAMLVLLILTLLSTLLLFVSKTFFVAFAIAFGIIGMLILTIVSLGEEE